MSTTQLFARSLNPMLDVQKAVSKTQQQISTNKRVLTPADDPVAATRILQLNQELADLGKYNNSLSALNNRMLREESALTGVSDQIQKAQELVLQAGNAALNWEQRKYLATELQTVVDSLAQLMNSKDAGGEFLFSGYQGQVQPFVKDADGRYVYQGDTGQRFVQVGPVTTIAANDSGYHLFMDIPGATPSLVAGASANNTANPPGQISSAEIRDMEQFSAFAPGAAVIEFRPASEASPAGPNFTVRSVADDRVLMANVPYVPGNEITFSGMTVRIQGQPAEGDMFTVETTDKKGLLEGLQDFIDDLQRFSDSASDRSRLQTSIANTLGNLENSQTRLLQVRSAVGARMNQIDYTQKSNEDFELTIRTALSELSDLDYAKALSQLTQEMFVLDAAQTSFAKITRLSLFNLI